MLNISLCMSQPYCAILNGSQRQTCLLFFAFACLPTLTFNWKVGLLSDLLLTLSSHTVSPPARRLFNSPQWSLFPLSCNQWLPPLELLMSPHWLHWDCCQVTEDSCSGWLLLAHHWLCCWEHSSAYSFEFFWISSWNTCSQPHRWIGGKNNNNFGSWHFGELWRLLMVPAVVQALDFSMSIVSKLAL